MYHTPPNTGSMAPEIEGLSTDFEALGGFGFLCFPYIFFLIAYTPSASIDDGSTSKGIF